MSLLSTVNLQKRFGGVFAINDVTFTMEKGSIHCLIGPNGAGKSTFFKMISGQYKPTTGKVYFQGNDITGLPPYQIARRGIGIKSQIPQLFNNLTVHEHIWLSARRNPSLNVADRVGELLETLRLEDVAHKDVGLLAHGARQWVEIATVIAPEPPLVLLDEPAAGMSDAEVDRTAELIHALKEKYSVLVVEHDMRFIRLVADRVTVFHRGDVFLEGEAADVLSDPGVKDIYLGKGVLEHA
jgi:branched-chain amino acid transport system ATP-binding protein/urea transport system ATP-binding protein